MAVTVKYDLLTVRKLHVGIDSEQFILWLCSQVSLVHSLEPEGEHKSSAQGGIRNISLKLLI